MSLLLCLMIEAWRRQHYHQGLAAWGFAELGYVACLGTEPKPGCVSGALENGDSAHLNEVERRQRELQSKQQQLLREQRSADQEKLLACITGGLPASPVPRESNLEFPAMRVMQDGIQ